jgi:hypothetical protein
MALLRRCIEERSGELARSEWTDRVAHSLVGAAAGDDAPSAAAMLEELAGPACHLVDLAEETIAVHGFDERYGKMMAKADRLRDMAKKRQRRKRERDGRVTSPSCNAPVTRDNSVTNAPVTREKRDVTDLDVDLDVDVDVRARHIKSPPLTGDVSVTGQSRDTAGKAHIAPETANGEQRRPQPTAPRPSGDPEMDRKHQLPDLTPTTEPANGILEGWLEAEEGTFREPIVLRQLVNVRDHNDPLTLLAHMRDLELMEDALSKCSLLMKRLSTAGIRPGEEAIEWARDQLNHDGRPRGGKPESPADVLASLRSAPAVDPDFAIAALDGLLTGWTAPDDTNHVEQRAAIKLALAEKPLATLAWAIKINNDLPTDDPLTRLAEFCSNGKTPPKTHLAAARKMAGLPARG